jgi:hypothetical protein
MKIIHMGLKVYDAMINEIKIFIFFSNAMLMQKSKYAKVKIINAMQKKVNMDNYRCYLMAKVRCLKSSERDSSLQWFIDRVLWFALKDEDCGDASTSGTSNSGATFFLPPC